MIVDPSGLRTTLLRACGDAGLDAAAFVMWIVGARRPRGATPIAYLHPAGSVRAGTVQVFRAVGAERAEAFAGVAHRLAVWRELPGLPESALGPMLRHELAHAVRWERSGTAFYEADERLRATVDGATYARLPTEREANAAAAAYARRTLTARELAELEAISELADLFAAQTPEDVVGETSALLGERIALAQASLAGWAAGPLVEVVAPSRAAGFAGMW